jgi:predicted glycosyltransferase
MSSRPGQKPSAKEGPAGTGGRKPRIAIFTHDTFGLGHVRRATHILRSLSGRLPEASLLLVTGSPALHRMPPLPANVDFVKIPTIVKTGSASWQPPHLPLSVHETTSLRKRIIRSTILGFAPDVFLVDNFPLGSRRELLPTLEELRERPTQTVLGLRDILDSPETVRANWTKDKTYEVLENLYDHVLIYGVRSIFDVAKSYGLSPRVSKKLTYCGYITDERPVVTSPLKLRRELGVKKPFILATGGGGGDAFPLLAAFVDATKLIPNCSALVLTGPLMSPADRQLLEVRANGHDRIMFKDFVPEVRDYVGAADAVVSMCGYNSATEILSMASRALVVPRTWQYGEHARRKSVIAEGEQIMRAEAMSRRGLLRMLPPDELDPEQLARELRSLLRSPRPDPKKLPSLQGLKNATRLLVRLATAR